MTGPAGAGGRGVGVGGARANGGSSPTIALGWIELGSWFCVPGPVELERPHVPLRA